MRYPMILLALVSLVLNLGAQGPPATLVETAPVQELEFPDQLTLVGRTEARSASRIVALVSGMVRSVDAAEGRRVRRGATLVTVDCRRIALALEAKEAEAAQAASDAALAAKELQRAQELVSTEVFPERNLDSAGAEASRSAERFRQLEAERQQLEIDVGNCHIRAPYAGTTVRKLVDVGEWVSPGTAVYELVDLAVVKVTVDLPERRFGQVELASPVTVALSGDGGELTGKVAGIAPQASQTTHTFPIMITVDNPDGRLGGGMLVNATLNLEGNVRSLAVSKDAIVRQGDRTLVFRVVDGAAVSVAVTTGPSLGEMVGVSGDGLAAGQEVVVRGNERIFDGGAVRVER